ncbi:MAG: hypothetical protein WBA22_08125 [Candidatus Methanofastidiosia archaeon]
MGNQGGDALPDPKKNYVKSSKKKMLVTICMVLICLGTFVNTVAAPRPPGDVLPDPCIGPLPILGSYNYSVQTQGIPATKNRTLS